jgi:hypothetical protein
MCAASVLQNAPGAAFITVITWSLPSGPLIRARKTTTTRRLSRSPLDGATRGGRLRGRAAVDNVAAVSGPRGLAAG